MFLLSSVINNVFSQDNNIDYKLGITQFEDGNISAAIAYFDKAILKDYKLVDAYYYRGQCYIRTGKNQKAVNDFTVVINDDSTQYMVYYYRGLSYSILKKYKEAIADYTASIALNDDNPNSYLDRCQAYHSIDSIELSLKDADKVLELMPMHSEAHLLAARANVELKKYEAALNYYNFLITQSPDTFYYYVLRGQLFMLMGRNEAACKDFKQAVALGNIEAEPEMHKACE